MCVQFELLVFRRGVVTSVMARLRGRSLMVVVGFQKNRHNH